MIKRTFIFAAVACLFVCSPCNICRAGEYLDTPKLPRDEIRKAKSQVEAYLYSEWTKDRIRRFCVPGTRHLTCFQGARSFTNNCIDGQLYKESASKLGKIKWDCCLNRTGKPIDVQVSITKPGLNQHWTIMHALNRERIKEDEFDKFIISTMLIHCRQAYLFAHNLREDVRAGEIPATTQVINVEYDASGRATKFVARLGYGQLLTSDLSRDMEMSNILVDGQPSKYWTEIAAEAEQNINQLAD